MKSSGLALGDSLLDTEMPVSRQDVRMMARALRLAERGTCTTHPNPRVGCVITQGDQVVGEGFHQRAGEPHAEVHALAMAGPAAQGATAYVTLEPCAHHGRTGPCADALIRAGVARVVVAMTDPNPLVAGQGLQRLREAGIEVSVGVQNTQAEALNTGFLKRMRAGRPWIRLKLGCSLDGRIAMASGESQWITGSQARADVQRLRARSDAILTGIGTVLADNPSLTFRARETILPAHWLPPERQPQRIVLDRQWRLPPRAHVLAAEGVCRVMGKDVAPERQAALAQAGAQVDVADDLNAVLARLGELGLNEVLVECGPRLSAAFLQSGSVDEVWLYQAPVLLGSRAQALADLPFERLSEGLRFTCVDQRWVGSDQRLILRPEVSS